MIEELAVEPEAGADAFGPAALLASIRSARSAEDAAAADVLELAARCGDSRTKVTIRPVIDLNQPKTAPGYEISDRIREDVVLRDRTCVFTAWHYAMVAPGVFEWTSPHGHRYRRDRTGTTALDPPDPPPPGIPSPRR